MVRLEVTPRIWPPLMPALVAGPTLMTWTPGKTALVTCGGFCWLPLKTPVLSVAAMSITSPGDTYPATACCSLAGIVKACQP